VLLFHLRRQRVATGLAPDAPRGNGWAEAQRRETVAMVVAHASVIRAAAAHHRVPPEAVAGATVWEGVENPYRRRVFLLGPGKVRVTELWRPAEAEMVEQDGRIPAAAGVRDRLRRLRDPVWAIEYVAAIMGRHADVYERVARVRIRDDVAVLCTLYQGGDSELRAARLALRLQHDPHAMPRPGNDMGPWVAANLAFVSDLIGSPPGSLVLAAAALLPDEHGHAGLQTVIEVDHVGHGHQHAAVRRADAQRSRKGAVDPDPAVEPQPARADPVLSHAGRDLRAGERAVHPRVARNKPDRILKHRRDREVAHTRWAVWPPDADPVGPSDDRRVTGAVV
jgi:hypothetical protein